MKRPALSFLLALCFCFASAALGQPLTRESTPEPLRPWIDWTLYGTTEQEHGPDFLRLANAFSALYPKGSEEKRLLDAMLLAV